MSGEREAGMTIDAHMIHLVGEAIIDELTSRRGFRQAFDDCDDGIQAEIRDALARAAIEAMREPTEEMTEHETYQHGMWSRRNIEAWLRAALGEP